MELINVLRILAAALFLHMIHALYASWHYSRKARSLGCLNLPLLPSMDPIGVTHLLQSLSADRVKLLPELFERRFRTMSELQKGYVSTFMIRSLGQHIVITADPKNIQSLLATQFSNFELGSVRRDSLCPLLGNGIFTANGEQWSHSRALLRPQFTRNQISQLDLEEKHVLRAMDAIHVGPTGWTTSTDIQCIFFRLTLDTATEFLFGESADSQLHYLEGRQCPEVSFAYSFDDSQAVCAQRLRFGWVASLLNCLRARQSDREVHAFVDRFVHKALQSQREEANIRHADKTRYVFLDALVAETQDPIELGSQCLNILLAGARYHCFTSELDRSVIGAPLGGFQQTPRRNHSKFWHLWLASGYKLLLIKVMPVFAILPERVTSSVPVVPFNRRSAVSDTALPHGGGADGKSPVFIKRGQIFMYSTHVMHRRKDIWGSDADSFDPERWRGRKVGWEYLPFNGGPRVCIGQQFALTEAGYTLVRLIQRFDQIEDVYPERQIRYGLSLTSCPADSVTVRMHQA